jgi:hypothetical protein
MCAGPKQILRMNSFAGANAAAKADNPTEHLGTTSSLSFDWHKKVQVLFSRLLHCLGCVMSHSALEFLYVRECTYEINEKLLLSVGKSSR